MPSAGDKIRASDIPRVLDYDSTTSISATTTGAAIDTGISVTASVITGRRYRVTAHFTGLRGTTGDSGQVTITDGSNVVMLGSGRIYIDATGVEVEGRTIILIDQPSTGTKTYKMRHENVTGGGATGVGASATRPTYIMVEDIGLV